MIKFIQFVSRFLSISKDQITYRKSIAELRALSDHQLRDIGISRGEIHSVVTALL